MIGAAARAGDDGARCEQPQALAEPLHLLRVREELVAHGLRRLPGLDVHPGRHLARAHEDTLSSATKS